MPFICTYSQQIL